jgi:hypothetical protein
MDQSKTACALLLGVAVSLAKAQGFALGTASGAELGVQLSDYHYEEEVNGSFFMSNQGSKLGLTGNLTRAFSGSWYLLMDGRFATGSVNYTGSGSGSKSNNPDWLMEGRLLAGHDFEVGGTLLSPFSGLGMRYLYDDLQGRTSTGAAGYRRESSYTYLPLGLTHRIRTGGDARLSNTFEYDHLLEGSQLSRLSDADPRSNDVRNTQKNGYGLRLSSSYETATWSAGVFYQAWNIGDSDRSLVTTNGVPSGTAIEPKNMTREIGVQLRYRFQ